MSVSLKDMNKPLLTLVVIAHVVAYLLLITGDLSIEGIKQSLIEVEQYAAAAIASVVVGVLNAQLDHKLKARIVFWRWGNPLPGSYAFSKYITYDPRIDVRSLENTHGPFPTEPDEQNRLWFKWYREVQSEPGVLQAHREYLFTRDWASLVVLLAVPLIPLAFYQMGEMVGLTFTLVILVEYLVVRVAARNHGIRFVSSVLAYKSSNG